MLKNDEIISVVPALSGYEIYWIDGKEFGPGEPVIAFVIVKTIRKDGSFFLSTYPLTHDSTVGDENSQEYALRCPSGQFDFSSGIFVSSKEEAEKLLKGLSLEVIKGGKDGA